jgi:urease accessory protein
VNSGGRTRLRRGPAFGPLYVQKPFYPEDELAHVYLLHPPGGVAGGDRLQIEIATDTGSSALFTTPAATKFYRSAGACARLAVQLQVGSDSSLEWLPQENLFFSGCSARLDTQIQLDSGARFIGWDLNCLGRPASADTFTTGTVDARLRLTRKSSAEAEQVVIQERNLWQAGSELLQAQWGLAGQSVIGTLYATPFDRDRLELLQRNLAAAGPQPASSALTLIEDVLVVRMLTNSGMEARAWLELVWRTLRPLVLARVASTPRIWNT